jgi:GxxExxY protein
MTIRLVDRLSDDEEMVAAETIGCALAVHRDLGPGYLESLYRKAMCLELRARALAFAVEMPVDVRYVARSSEPTASTSSFRACSWWS